MTDYLALAKRMDDMYHLDQPPEEFYAAADAIRAQARRIAELEDEIRSDFKEATAALEAQAHRIAELEAALKDATVRLVAAISLLERGGKKAAPSNKMFEQMLVDYKNGVERARAALGEKDE